MVAPFRKRAFFGVAVLCVCTAVSGAGAGAAQEYPARPIRIVVPYAPGGQGDITGRLIATRLSPRMGQPVVVENRPGANGVIGTEIVAKATPDGHTLAVVVASHVLSRALLSKLPFDPVKSFAAITMTARTRMVLVSTTKLPVNNFQEFLDYARANPNKVAYKSSGNGSNSHLFGEWLADVAGLKMIHVPYKGSGSSLPDLLSGQVQVGFETLPAIQSQIAAGTVRLLAAAGTERLPQYPNAPTIGETFRGFNAESWGMVLAPANTPQPIIERLNKEIVAILKTPEVVERFASMGAAVVGTSASETQKILRQEDEFYVNLVKRLGITLDK